MVPDSPVNHDARLTSRKHLGRAVNDIGVVVDQKPTERDGVAMMFPPDLKAPPPQPVEDLHGFDAKSREVSIGGPTRGIEKLKDCPALERVWVSNVKQGEFERIAEVINPASLVVYDMKVQDLTPLAIMSRIERLALTWNTKSIDISSLARLRSLTVLSLMDFPKLSRLDSLARCEKLEMLELGGGVWKPMTVITLEPLRSLRALKYLSLTNIKVEDDSLDPLTELTNLQELNLSNQFPTEEYARLSVYLEHVHCRSFQPYESMEGRVIGSKTTMITGRRKPFLDPQADRQRIQRYERQFEDYQAMFRAEREASLDRESAPK